MLRTIVPWGRIIGTLGTLAAAAAGQTPTFSLEVFEVNGKPLAGGSAGIVEVVAGDTLTAKILLRDWSPNGEKLRSYQATLDPLTFKSGERGTVQPVAYEEALENEANAFIDEHDPMYILHGLHILPLMETSSGSYRWITVLFDGETGPISKQDGKKCSCGTVRLKVSEDAGGAFTLRLFEDQQTSMILDPSNQKILPLEFEPLVVQVAEGSFWLRIESSDPPDLAIDARMPKDNTKECSWDTIRVYAPGDARGLSADDFQLEDGSATPRRIRQLAAEGSTAVLMLSRGIPMGVWTTVTHLKSRSSIRLACLPGDVNNDQQVDAQDLHALVLALNGAAAFRDFQTDLNRDGQTDGRDLAALIEFLAATEIVLTKRIQ